jgi:hypothetical protein
MLRSMAEHQYPPGWTTDQDFPTLWQYVEDDMEAWRFCPVCGLALLDEKSAISTEPRCSGCDRPFEACPCACTVEH